MRLDVQIGDITKLEVDAIVNAANERLLGGGGVDGAIHAAAGPELLTACRAIPELRPGVRCPTGEARITRAFRLPARFVVHTVGPVWQGGARREAALLQSCYRSALELARQHGARTVAFPSISTGAFGFPRFLASRGAARACAAFLRDDSQLQRVTLVAFSAQDGALLRDAVFEVTRPPARRADREIVALPQERARLHVERHYTREQLGWLKYGILPREMEDKWFAFYEAPWLYLHRSWTGHCIFEVRLEEDATGGRIVEIWANRDPQQYEQTDDAADARYLLSLLDGWAGRDPEESRS